MNLSIPVPTVTSYFGLYVSLMAVGTVIVHVGFATAVAKDAARLARENAGPLIVGTFLWTLATLLGGAYVAALYWLVNHSSLSRR